MKRIFHLALLGLLFPAQLFSAHVITSYAEFAIDSATNQITLEYHVLFDSLGIATMPSSILAVGPVNVTMPRDTVIAYSRRLGGPFCSAPVTYEAIYRASGVNLPNPFNGTYKTYDFGLPCCARTSQNMALFVPTVASISFRARPRGGGFFFYPNISTLGTTRNFLQEAYAGLQNLSDFGQNYIPGVDSVNFELKGVPQYGGTFAALVPGYSAITPLPDVSEDSLNGPNLFYPELGVLKSYALDSSFSEGSYSVGVERKTYYNGLLYTTDRSVFQVYYHHRDTSISAFDLRVRTPDSVFRTNNPTTHLTYHLKEGDSLEVDITAIGNTGDVMVLLSDTLLEPLDTSELPSGANYGLPKLSSLNPGGGFVNLDSNSVRFSFVPTLVNIVYMRGRNFFKLVFGQNNCGGDVHSVLIEVVFDQTPRILIWGEERDSVELCTALVPELDLFNPNSSFRWVPAALFSSATNRNTTVTAKTSRWYYLVNPSSGRLMDSIHLNFIPVEDTLYQINADTIASRLILNDSMMSSSQVWRIADMIQVESLMEDELPIMGPGSYHVLSRFNPFQCPHYSDTVGISYNSLWAANYGKTQGADSLILDTVRGRIRYKLMIQPTVGTEYVSELYIKGLKDVSENGSSIVVVSLTSNQGLNVVDTFDLKQGTYIGIPLSETMSNSDNLELIVDIQGTVAYHKLEIPGVSFFAGDFRYYNNQIGIGFAGFQNGLSSVPIGLKYVNAIGLDELNNANLISVYPSPTTGLLQVMGDELKGKSWQLSSLGGTKLMEGAFDGDEKEIDVTHLPAGIYLLSVDGQVLKVVRE